MPAIATYGVTGDANLDGILTGRKWAVDSLTFSFPSDPSQYASPYGSGEPTNGFQAFNAAEQTAVRTILGSYASLLNLGFTEVAETTTSHGALRYAETNAVSTAWGYYPSTSETGGDMWFNSASGYYDNPVKGNYAWVSILHETGHALGLKHPHEILGSFGTMPLEHDSLEYTVMSYRSYVGASTTSGYTNGATSYPQTLMMYDIAALQQMYGADFTTNAGNTVYRWSPTTGEMLIDDVAQGRPAGNKIFMTLWDGGGIDTYDFSNYTVGLKVNLEPGQWTTTSATQLASLGTGKVAIGNIANALLYQGNLASLIENALGGTAGDVFAGNAADNHFTGNGGNDLLDGAGGTNTALYSGRAADYSWITNADGSLTIADLRSGSPDGTDTLTHIQFMQFIDSVVATGTPTLPADPVVTDPVVPPPVVNSAPVAMADYYSVVKNTKLTIPAAGLLANDTDANGDHLSAILVTKPVKGTLALNTDGSFSYTPVKNFTGTVSFSYKTNDGTADSNVATVTLSVGGGTSTAKGNAPSLEQLWTSGMFGHGGSEEQSARHAGTDEDQMPTPDHLAGLFGQHDFSHDTHASYWHA